MTTSTAPDHHVGWCIDHIWFNGRAMNMPENSGAMESGTGVPGEIENHVNTGGWTTRASLLTGPVEISLPIANARAYRLQPDQSSRKNTT
jgi:hypothetical protein